MLRETVFTFVLPEEGGRDDHAERGQVERPEQRRQGRHDALGRRMHGRLARGGSCASPAVLRVRGAPLPHEPRQEGPESVRQAHPLAQQRQHLNGISLFEEGGKGRLFICILHAAA